MRTSVALLFTLGALVATTGAGYAQIGRATAQLSPMVETERIRAGASARLLLKVVLPEGFHVQSNTPSDPAFIPTELTLELPEGVTMEELVYPPAVELKQQGQVKPLSVFGREFTIGIWVAIEAKVLPGELVVGGRLLYQACNEKACYPPVSAQTEWVLEVVPKPAAPTQHGDPFGALHNAARVIRVAAVPASVEKPCVISSAGL